MPHGLSLDCKLGSQHTDQSPAPCCLGPPVQEGFAGHSCKCSAMSGADQAVRHWASYLKQQQQLISNLEAGTATREQIGRLIQFLQRCGGLKGLTRAAWKKLVNDMEVGEGA